MSDISEPIRATRVNQQDTNLMQHRSVYSILVSFIKCPSIIHSLAGATFECKHECFEYENGKN